MNEKDVMHIYNGILLSHKKERNLVICRDVDGPKICHTEWSKSEREKQVSYTDAYMFSVFKNLPTWFWSAASFENVLSKPTIIAALFPIYRWETSKQRESALVPSCSVAGLGVLPHPRRSPGQHPLTLPGCYTMRAEHGSQVWPRRGEAVLPVALYDSLQPRFSPELSLRNRIWTLWLWVLMGSGAFSPQKGPRTFGPALICEGQDRKKAESHLSGSDCFWDHRYSAPRVFWKLPCESMVFTHILSGHYHSPMGSISTLPFTDYNDLGSGQGRLIFLSSEMNILWFREGQSPVQVHRTENAPACKDPAV